MNGGTDLPQRRTLKSNAEIRGFGLFSNQPCSCTIQPAQAGDGLMFVRTDLSPSPRIPALINHVAPRPSHPAMARLPGRNTVLALDPADDSSPAIATVEHVLSALVGLGVTDALILIDGPELPILDGSALPFARAINDAGILELAASIEPIRLTRPITVTQQDSSITAEPRDLPGCEFVYELDYGPQGPFAPQRAVWESSTATYCDQVAPARTFCLQSEAKAMQDLGLFEHLSSRDMLVFGPDGPIENTLLFDDEPARHKLLDLIGDLALAGRPIQARITATRSGHALNHALARALVSD